METDSTLLDALARVFAAAAVESVVQELEKGAVDAGKTSTAEMSIQIRKLDNENFNTSPGAPGPR
jgi:hypothetical protein